MPNIQNVHNTSDEPYCTFCNQNWIRHWELVKDEERPSKCIIPDCNFNSDVVGAHVKKTDDGSDDRIYIAPICQDHNIREEFQEEDMEIEDYNILVDAATIECITN